MRIYTNGFLNNTATTTVMAQYVNALNITIGARPSTTGGNPDTPFNGLIDCVRIYARALSAAEIAGLVPPRLLPPLLINHELILDWAGPGQLQAAFVVAGGCTNIIPAPNPPHTTDVTQAGHRFFRLQALP